MKKTQLKGAKVEAVTDRKKVNANHADGSPLMCSVQGMDKHGDGLRQAHSLNQVTLLLCVCGCGKLGAAVAYSSLLVVTLYCIAGTLYYNCILYCRHNPKMLYDIAGFSCASQLQWPPGPPAATWTVSRQKLSLKSLLRGLSIT